MWVAQRLMELESHFGIMMLHKIGLITLFQLFYSEKCWRSQGSTHKRKSFRSAYGVSSVLWYEVFVIPLLNPGIHTYGLTDMQPNCN